jgi:hypothetical protein
MSNGRRRRVRTGRLKHLLFWASKYVTHKSSLCHPQIAGWKCQSLVTFRAELTPGRGHGLCDTYPVPKLRRPHTGHPDRKKNLTDG